MNPMSDSVSRRSVLGKLGGASLVALGAASVGASADGDLSVETGDATRERDTGAVLYGELKDLGGADEVEVYFEYWVAEDEDCPFDDGEVKTTDSQVLTEPGEFSEWAASNCPNTWHGFRAVAETDDDRDTGEEGGFFTPTI